MAQGLRIGINPHSLRPVLFPIKPSNGTLILAPPRQGKSLIAMNVYVQMQYRRRLFIIDYAGEHANCIWMNMRSRHHADYVKNLMSIKAEDITFYLSDFDSIQDAWGLGFAKAGAQTFRRFASSPEWIDCHKDNPYKFLKLVEDLPLTYGQLASFNEEYFSEAHPRELRAPFSSNSMAPLLNSVRSMIERGVFGDPADGKAHITDWISLLEKQNLHLDLQLSASGIDIAKARAWVGIILRSMRRDSRMLQRLRKIKPLFIIEEADKLLPPTKTLLEGEPSSSRELKELLSKLGKYGGEMIFLTQSDDMIAEEIYDNTRTKILGRLETGKDARETASLGRDEITNRREFILRDEGRISRFIPDDVPCCYANYDDDNLYWKGNT